MSIREYKYSIRTKNHGVPVHKCCAHTLQIVQHSKLLVGPIWGKMSIRSTDWRISYCGPINNKILLLMEFYFILFGLLFVWYNAIRWMCVCGNRDRCNRAYWAILSCSVFLPLYRDELPVEIHSHGNVAVDDSLFDRYFLLHIHEFFLLMFHTGPRNGTFSIFDIPLICKHVGHGELVLAKKV